MQSETVEFWKSSAVSKSGSSGSRESHNAVANQQKQLYVRNTASVRSVLISSFRYVLHSTNLQCANVFSHVRHPSLPFPNLHSL